MKITEILSRLSISFLTEGHHHCRPGWVQIDCPFCGRGLGKFHMGIAVSNSAVNCWKCGPRSPVKVLSVAGRISEEEARALLGRIDRKKIQVEQVKRGKLLIPSGVKPLTPPHQKYLESRGFDPDLIVSQWAVQGIGLATRLAWRLFIPYLLDGETVSWNTRSISPEADCRYYGASPEEEAVNRKSLLYGEDYCKFSVIVVEGEIDAWRIGPGCVAVGGTSYTTAQVKRIAQYPMRVVCFDNEKEAQKRASRLTDDLSVMPGQTFKVCLESKDPGSASLREVAELRSLAGI